MKKIPKKNKEILVALAKKKLECFLEYNVKGLTLEHVVQRPDALMGGYDVLVPCPIPCSPHEIGIYKICVDPFVAPYCYVGNDTILEYNNLPGQIQEILDKIFVFKQEFLFNLAEYFEMIENL